MQPVGEACKSPPPAGGIPFSRALRRRRGLGQTRLRQKARAVYLEGSNIMQLLNVEQPYLKSDVPEFRAGDTVKVHVRVVEGKKQRIQIFQGVVIARKGGGSRETFTVRKISGGIGVERVLPLHSPVIEKLEVVRRGKVRRAKLYYLRELRGKAARIEERRD